MDKFRSKYRIPSNRLSGFDYGSNAFYFVTICSKNKEHYFGKIISNSVETHNNASPSMIINDTNELNKHNGASLQMTQIGLIAYKYWLEIPKHYPFVTIDEFIIMPNHIHGILYLNPLDKTDWTPNKFGPQSNNLGAIIRGFKSSVKRYANQNKIQFEWQTRYHDRIIRNEKEYCAIKNYIINNPKNWRSNEKS